MELSREYVVSVVSFTAEGVCLSTTSLARMGKAMHYGGIVEDKRGQLQMYKHKNEEVSHVNKI